MCLRWPAAMLLAALLFLPCLLLPGGAALAGPATDALRLGPIDKGAEASLGGTLTLHLPGLKPAMEQDGLTEQAVVLVLNGQPLAASTGQFHPNEETIDFLLRRAPVDAEADALAKDRRAWRAILGSPPFGGRRDVLVGVSVAGRNLPYAGPGSPIVSFAVFAPWQLGIAGVVAVAFLLVFRRMALHSAALRDSLPADAPAGSDPAKAPLSLARCQMALWFLLTVCSYLMIWALSWDYNGIITTQSMVLLGISGATGLFAVTVDDVATKPRSAVSQGWLTDLLTDADGLTVHRLQLVSWTVIMAAVFIWSVYRNLSLPQFDEALLTLMGISSGVYVGFKFPEKPG